MPYYIGKAVDHCEFDIKADCFILYFDEALLAQWKQRGDSFLEVIKIDKEMIKITFNDISQYVTFFINPIRYDQHIILPKVLTDALVYIDEEDGIIIYDELPEFLEIYIKNNNSQGRYGLVTNIDFVIQIFFHPSKDNHIFTISGYVKNTDILVESKMQISISFLEKALADKEFGRWKGEESNNIMKHNIIKGLNFEIKTLEIPKTSEEVIQALNTEEEVICFEKVKTLALLGIFYELHELGKTTGRISNKLSLGGR
jgi:hypothetical protein